MSIAYILYFYGTKLCKCMSCVNVHVADSVQVKCMELFIYMYVLLLGECAIIMRTLLFNSLNKHENVFWHIYLFIYLFLLFRQI